VLSCACWNRVESLAEAFPFAGHSSDQPLFSSWRQGDVSETIRLFFEQSKSCPPAAKSLLTIQEVDEFLIQLSKLTKEDDQQSVLQDITRR